MPHYSDRESDNRGKLAAFDALTNQDQRAAITDMRLQRSAFDIAARQVEQQQRERGLELRETGLNIRDETSARMAAMHEQAAALKAAAEEAKRGEAEKKLQDGVNFWGEVGNLDPKSQDFDAKLADLRMRTHRAADQDDIKAHTQHLYKLRSDFMEHQRATDEATARLAELRNQGFLPKTETVRTPGGEVVMTSPRDAAQVDPLKMATQIRGQIRSLDDQLRSHDKTIADIEKDTPAWLNSTGIFQDTRGRKRFGYVDKVVDDVDQPKETPLVKPQEEIAFNRYQAAVKARTELADRLPKLNQQLDDVLNGNVPAATPAARVDSINPPAAAPTGYSTAEDVRAAYKAGKLQRDEAEQVLRTQFGHN